MTEYSLLGEKIYILHPEHHLLPTYSEKYHSLKLVVSTISYLRMRDAYMLTTSSNCFAFGLSIYSIMKHRNKQQHCLVIKINT